MSVLPITATVQGTNPGLHRLADGFQAASDAVATMDDRDKQEIARLRSKHGDYVEREDHWRFCLRAYEGGPGYVSEDTLFKHCRENTEDYQDRLVRATYWNYCQPLVDFVPEYIFKDPIEREADESVQDEFSRFVDDVDWQGRDLSTFMRMVAEDARIYGKVFIQVDMPSVDAGRELSVQEAEELGVNRQYLILVSPLEVLNWRTDSYGKYTYIKRVEVTTLEDGTPIERYYEWKRDKVEVSVVDISGEKPKLIETRVAKDNKWGEVPFVPVVPKQSKSNREQGLSFLNDIAYQNRHLFNLTSLIDEFLYRQAFNILAMEKDTAIPTKESTEGVLGTSNVLEVPSGAEHFPAYISPPVDPAKFIQDERRIVIQEMYRQAAQDVASELFAVSNRSGDAAKQAFGRMVPVMATLADTLQAVEVGVMRLWAKTIGKEWKGKISYREDFSVTNLQDLIFQLTMIFNSLHVLPPTFVREEWKRIVREFDGRIPRETMEKIVNEIDNISDADLLGWYQATPGGGQKTAVGMPTAAQMIQGRQQQGKTDAQIGAMRGDNTGVKEKMPDRDQPYNTK